MSKDLIIALIAVLIGLTVWGLFGVIHSRQTDSLPFGVADYLKPLPPTLNLDLSAQSAKVK
ncbi:MAG: hypothetical protein NT141_02335 [candidate division WWE3 bacterium]|nr:hypothetical protein [candidate division WWE3 bacterium]